VEIQSNVTRTEKGNHVMEREIPAMASAKIEKDAPNVYMKTGNISGTLTLVVQNSYPCPVRL